MRKKLPIQFRTIPCGHADRKLKKKLNDRHFSIHGSCIVTIFLLYTKHFCIKVSLDYVIDKEAQILHSKVFFELVA